MNNDLLIIDKSGKAWRCVDYRLAADDELFLTGTRLYVDRQRAGEVRYERHILEEVPSPYILREDAEALRLAADELAVTAKNILDHTQAITDVSPMRWQDLSDARDETLAALEPFQSPPEVQERFTVENGFQVRDNGRKEPDFFTPPNGISTTDYAAALNELSKEGQ